MVFHFKQLPHFWVCAACLSLIACDDDDDASEDASLPVKTDAESRQDAAVNEDAIAQDADQDAESDADALPQTDGAIEWQTEPHATSFAIEPPTAPNYLLVADDRLEAEAQTLANWRKEMGYLVEIYKVSDLVQGVPTVDGLETAIHEKLQAMRANLPENETLYLALLGDAPEADAIQEGQILAKPCENDLASTNGCFTDNHYGDLDGDHMPEVAVGRIPAKTREQAANYIEKLKTYESVYEVGPWNRRLAFYVGDPGFKENINKILENVVMKGLDLGHPAFEITGAYYQPSSPYYYTPFPEKVIELFNAGNLITAYMGHGSPSGTEGLRLNNIEQLNCQHRLPMTFFFACSNGVYVGESDSIAEALLWLPNASIATFAASGTSHPLPNAVYFYELERAAFDLQPRTVGQLSLLLKHRLIENKDSFRNTVDTAASLANLSSEEQARSLDQHLNLYNLFGDPATATKMPFKSAVFDEITGKNADKNLHVKGHIDGFSGIALVTLECARNAIWKPIEPIDEDNIDEEVVHRNWANANEKMVAQQRVYVTDGQFEADLSHSQDLVSGSYYIKVYAEDGSIDAIGGQKAP